MSVYFINYPEDNGKKFKHFVYPAGESQVRILSHQYEQIKEADKVVITARIVTGDLMPIQFLIDAVRALMIKEVILILPYLPYSRADRRFEEGDCYGMGIYDYFFQDIDKIVTFDVHNPKVCNRITNVSPLQLIQEIIVYKQWGIVIPDEGASTRISWDKVPGPKYQCTKIRNPQSGALSGFKTPTIYTKEIIIVDDLCDAGGTFNGLVDEIHKTQPDVRCYLYVSHGIFSKGFEELEKRFDRIYTTDSFARVESPSPLLCVYPIDGALKTSVLTTAELYEQFK